MSARSRAKRRSTPGAQHLDRDVALALLGRRPRRDAPGRSRRRRPARRTRRTRVSIGRAERRLDDARPRPGGGIGVTRSCRLSSSRATFGPDDVGPGRQELAELDVGRPEPVDRARQARRARARRAGDQIGERERQAARPAAAASGRRRRTRPRARTRSRRARAGALWPTAARIDMRSELPARMDGDDRRRSAGRSRRARSRRRRSCRRTARASGTCGSIRRDSGRARRRRRRPCRSPGSRRRNRRRRARSSTGRSTRENSRQRKRPPRLSTR